jgi:hypothetical protein
MSKEGANAETDVPLSAEGAVCKNLLASALESVDHSPCEGLPATISHPVDPWFLKALLRDVYVLFHKKHKLKILLFLISVTLRR